jgi:hypothetical protein
MQDFDSIKTLWQNAAPGAPLPLDRKALMQKSKDTRTLLIRQLALGGIALFLTACFIFWLIYFSAVKLTWLTTHIAVWIIILTVLIQTGINGFSVYKLSRIDDTVSPSLHLKQWENYYAFRMQRLHINKKIYFIFLNLGMGLYMLEILKGRPVGFGIFLVLMYSAWMLYAYFILGKKVIEKERKHINEVIDHLKAVENQFHTDA